MEDSLELNPKDWDIEVDVLFTHIDAGQDTQLETETEKVI